MTVSDAVKRITEFCAARNSCYKDGVPCPLKHYCTFKNYAEETDGNELAQLLNMISKDEKSVKNDSVNHPSHYCQEGSMECLDEMGAVFGKDALMTFCLLNVWKYRKRALYKNGEEDLKKSDFYMKKYVELKEEMNNGKTDQLPAD